MDIDTFSSIAENGPAKGQPEVTPKFMQAAVSFRSANSDPIVIGEPAQHGDQAKDSRTCEVCGDSGHQRADCPDKNKNKRCANCGLYGHVRTTCPNFNAIFCKICDSNTHMTYDCTEPMVCKICNGKFHAQFDCQALPPPAPTRSSQEKEKLTANLGLFIQPGYQSLAAVRFNTQYKPTGATAGAPMEKRRSELYLHSFVIPPEVKMHGFAEKSLEGKTAAKEVQSEFQLLTTDEEGFVPTLMAFRIPMSEANIRELSAIFPVGIEKLTKWLWGDQTILVEIPYYVDGVERPAGCNFFTHNDLGQFTNLFEQARTWCETLRPVEQPGKIAFLIRDEDCTFISAVNEWNRKYHLQSISGGPYGEFTQGGLFIAQHGAEIPPHMRPKTRIGARGAYTHPNEMLLQNFYNVVCEEELWKAKKQVMDTFKISARFSPILHKKNTELYAYFEADENMPFPLKAGDTFKMVLKWGQNSGQRIEDWHGRIIEPHGLAPADFICATVTRPWIKENEDAGITASSFDDTILPPGSCIDPLDPIANKNAASFRAALNQCAPCIVVIKVDLDSEQSKRNINTLRHAQLPWTQTEGETLSDEEKRELQRDMDDKVNYLTFRNLRHLGTVDVFASVRGHEKFESVMNEAIADFNQGQLDVFNFFQDSCGPIKFVQGVPGSGKTSILNAVVKIFYKLTNGPTQLVVLAPENEMVNGLAEKLEKLLSDIWKLYPDLLPYPLIVREHSPKTENSLLKRHANIERDARVSRPADAKPIYEEDENIDTSVIPVAQELFKLNERRKTQLHKGVHDRRVKHLHLSRGDITLKATGYLKQEDGSLYPFACQTPGRFDDFNRHLGKIARGEELQKEEKENWPILLAEANEYVNSRLCVQLATTATYQAHGVFSAIRNPPVVMLDEAAKTSEMNAAGCVVLNRGRCFIMVGDINQNKHMVSIEPDALLFGRQASISLFNRAIMSGAPLARLFEQFRLPLSVANMMKFLGAQGLEVHPSVMQRPGVLEGQKFIETTFGIKDSNHVLVNVQGTQSFRPAYSKSKFNKQNIDVVLYYVIAAIKFGFTVDQIGILAPYTAQTDEYRIALYNLASFAADFDGIDLKTRVALNTIATAVRNQSMSVHTFDSGQGKEKDVIFADTVTSDRGGFVNHHGKLYVAGSRALRSLVWLGSTEGWESSAKEVGHKYTNTKLGKLAEFCKGREASATKEAIPCTMYNISKEEIAIFSPPLSHALNTAMSTLPARNTDKKYAFDYDPSTEPPPKPTQQDGGEQSNETGEADPFAGFGSAEPDVPSTWGETQPSGDDVAEASGTNHADTPQERKLTEAEEAYLRERKEGRVIGSLNGGWLPIHMKHALDAKLEEDARKEAAEVSKKAEEALAQKVELGRLAFLREMREGLAIGSLGHPISEEDQNAIIAQLQADAERDLANAEADAAKAAADKAAEDEAEFEAAKKAAAERISYLAAMRPAVSKNAVENRIKKGKGKKVDMDAANEVTDEQQYG